MSNKEDEPQDGDYADLDDQNQEGEGQEKKEVSQNGGGVGDNQEGGENENKKEECKAEEDEAAQNENDLKSVYVQNVEYTCTVEDVQNHFKDCGTIVQITILRDKYTKQPKGGAYIQFEDVDSAEIAKGLSDSTLRGRQIKVVAKRTNIPNFGGKRGRPKQRGMMRFMGFPGMYGRGGFIFPGYRRPARRFAPHQ